jgi:hypothetical protein
MFVKLARSGGHVVEAGIDAGGGESFAQHVASRDAAESLKLRKWNVVVLQEQSQIPAVASWRRTYMVPAAQQLASMIRAMAGEPIFFLTWAHREGWPEHGLFGYAAMQAAIDSGYLTVSRELDVGVAPVGYAWAAIHKEQPRARLWQADGSHPTVGGTYLAACVFYATIFHQGLEGLRYHADLPAREAAMLRKTASQIVLSDPGRWRVG